MHHDSPQSPPLRSIRSWYQCLPRFPAARLQDRIVLLAAITGSLGLIVMLVLAVVGYRMLSDRMARTLQTCLLHESNRIVAHHLDSVSDRLRAQFERGLNELEWHASLHETVPRFDPPGPFARTSTSDAQAPLDIRPRRCLTNVRLVPWEAPVDSADRSDSAPALILIRPPSVSKQEPSPLAAVDAFQLVRPFVRPANPVDRSLTALAADLPFAALVDALRVPALGPGAFSILMRTDGWALLTAESASRLNVHATNGIPAVLADLRSTALQDMRSLIDATNAAPRTIRIGEADHRVGIRTLLDVREWSDTGPSNETSWSLAVVAPEEDLMAHLEPARRAFAQEAWWVQLWQFIAAAATLLAIGLSLRWTGRSIGAAMGSLTQAAEQIERSNYDIRVEITGDGELGRLGAAFNQMAGAIQTNTRDLENTVRSRTGELQNANAEIRSLNARLLDDNHRLEIDIHQRRLAESALREREAQLVTVLNNAPVVLWAIDPHGIFTLSRGLGLASLGLQQDEVVGQSVFDLYGHNSEIIEDIRSVLAGATVIAQRTVNDRVYEVRHEPLRDESGNVSGAIGLAVDITERRRAAEETERALRREQELNELKSNFLTMVSHELRTPVTTIVVSCNLLRNRGAELNEELRARHLELIRQATHYMTSFLDRVTTLNEAETGKLDCKPLAIDVAAFLRSLCAEFRIAHTSHTIDCEIEHPEPAFYAVDAVLLRHILGNLLSNAVKYSPNDGHVLCTFRRARDLLEFSVRDDGIGIPLTDQFLLFHSFHRGSNVGTIRGTGIGLLVAKRAAERHGGAIRFESEPGKGTTFFVSIPAVPSRPDPDTPIPPLDPPSPSLDL